MVHSDGNSQSIDAIAERHKFSRAAVESLLAALKSGGGRMAQFSHPELGGMGQWSGGMLMIGEMSNSALKARVSALCSDLVKIIENDVPSASQSLPEHLSQKSEFIKRKDWWPDSLGEPASVGGQNDSEYAYFKNANRLAVRSDNKVTIYDTTGYEIFGASQQQSNSKSVTFESQRGCVGLNNLSVIETRKL